MLDKEEDPDRYMTSDERRQKHGERKRLGELRKVVRKDAKKRKVLRLEDEVRDCPL